MNEDIQETRLDNGLVVLTDRMPGVRSVTLGFFYRTGARHEPAELNGITHFIEHTVFKGTAERSTLDIAIALDRLGGTLDAFTTHEETGFVLKVIDDQLDTAFDLLADMLENPRFEEQDLINEQHVIIEEMKMIDDNPEELLGEIFQREFFAGDPLGLSIPGTPETVKTFDHDRTREYHEKHFTPANLVIAAAGNLDNDRMCLLAQSLAKNQPVRETPPPVLSQAGSSGPATTPAFIVKHRADLEQAHLLIATRFVAAPDDRRYAADLLATILGGGTSSRLWQKIREERGLAYSVGAGAVMYQDVGNFSVAAATSPEQTREVVDLSIAEMRDVVRNGVTADELELAKQQSRASILLSLEDSASRAGTLAQSEMTHGRQISVDETIDSINAVTLDDCQAIAIEFFQTDRIAFAAIGDIKSDTLTRDDLTL
ncbi:MAG: M16 family metallopeptidase [Pyrinomonadaceae bacterium]